MDDLDRAIVNALQDGFPLSERPFLDSANALDTSEQDLIARIARMIEDGTLTRFGPLYHAERAGGAFTLAAMQVPAADYERVAAAVNALPEVAHNYAREHALNMWFVLGTEAPEGIAAAIATFHDVLAVLGVLYLANKEITLLVVTALLTLAGYSLTDKVVVFDRIRENLKFRRRESLEQVINGGINQVLSRTIVVSLTVVLVLVALFFFGGEVIHDFSFALLVGVIVGNYSSIFVASSILLVWRGTGGKLLKRA